MSWFLIYLSPGLLLAFICLRGNLILNARKSAWRERYTLNDHIVFFVLTLLLWPIALGKLAYEMYKWR